MSLTEEERKEFEKELKELETEGNRQIESVQRMIEEMEKARSGEDADRRRRNSACRTDQDPKFVAEQAQLSILSHCSIDLDAGHQKIEVAEGLQAAGQLSKRLRSMSAIASSTA
jgi:DNA-directed RNA polymerase subunit beta